MTNSATGEIGALLAEALATRGFQTLLFRARGATHTHVPSGALLHEFATNHDLVRALEALAETRAAEVRAVFHAAALSDYDLRAVRGPDGSLLGSAKIPGNLPQLHLLLEPAAKVLPLLRGWFPRAWMVGWKYELEGTREDATKSARGANVVKKYVNARGLTILTALDAVAQLHHTRPGVVAIAWLLTRLGITSPIASATSLAQLADLVAATQLRLTPADITALDAASAEVR